MTQDIRHIFRPEDLKPGCKIVYFFPAYVEIRKNLRKNHRGCFVLKYVSCILTIKKSSNQKILTNKKDFDLAFGDSSEFIIPYVLYKQIKSKENTDSYSILSDIFMNSKMHKAIKNTLYKTTQIKEEYSYIEQVQMQTDLF